jgi:PTH1 family peptidyl-tRNA hydrolase
MLCHAARAAGQYARNISACQTLRLTNLFFILMLMKLLIGLGNIGAHFDGTRHNAGFAVLDALAAKHALHWTAKDKFKALVAEDDMQGQKVVLAKPTTYYNLSGEAVRALKDFYKLDASDVLVIHDELALPFGTVRARSSGSDAGNNGIKSVVAHIGEDFARVRIGTANNQAQAADAVDFVLSRFTKEEAEQWPHVVGKAIELVGQFIDPNKKFEHTSVRIPE